MRFGVNWISPSQLPLIRDLIADGLVDFCEIMADNFVHLPASVILKALPSVPIALHLVSSRFLERPLTELHSLANQLRPWIKALHPIYVSDHLLSFTTQEGRVSPLINEWDYENAHAHMIDRIKLWQEWLNIPLIFENHASLTARGKAQATFFDFLIKETKSNLLYDFSNAYVAEMNGVSPRMDWKNLILSVKHFHVAGFRIDSATGFALDTHDRPIDEEVLNDLSSHFAYHRNDQDKTIVIESDVRIDKKMWQQEILRTKQHILYRKSKEKELAIHIEVNNPHPSKQAHALLKINTEEKLNILFQQNRFHFIFHLVPSILKLSSHNGKDILDEFIKWLDHNSLATRWTMHLQLLNWLAHHLKWQTMLTPEMIKELLIASMTRWSLSGLEDVAAQGIMVATPLLPGLAMGLWKNSQADRTNKVVKISLPTQLQISELCYATSYQQGSWNDIQWKSLSSHSMEL